MKLLEPTQLSGIPLKNRMVMSAMTRSRADQQGVVGDLTARYYTQRAGAGMLLSEAINISRQAFGSPLTPGLFTEAQIEGWKRITRAVHDHGGVLFAQLWHTGRVGHSVDRGGELPVAPSPVAIQGAQHFTSQGMKEYETPREITVDEIQQTVKDYGQAAKNALAAGFDGVELHAANGYLPNQFLSDSANHRTDAYGGSIPNKARFVLEVMEEIIAAVGGDKVGIKIGTLHPYGGMEYDDPVATYTYLIEQLNTLDFSFVELMRKNPYFPPPARYPEIDEVELFGGMIRQTVIANAGYDRASAEAELERGRVELISFGTPFIANPDLPERFARNAELTQPDRATMFGGGEHGYTDYPPLGESATAAVERD